MSLVSVIDLVMRIPPLFVIDELLRIDLGLPSKDSALGQVLADQQFGNVSETFVANATSSSFLDCDGCDSYAMMTLVLLANVTGKRFSHKFSPSIDVFFNLFKLIIR